MLQFRVKIAKIMSNAETRTITLVFSDDTQYVIRVTTDVDHYHNIEARLLWNAMNYTDFRDAERENLLIREAEQALMMEGVETFEGKWASRGSGCNRLPSS